MLEVLARIRHRRTRRQLSSFLDGMLSPRESRRLEAHLAQCRACRDELAELRATVQALAGLPLVEAPRSFALAAAPRRVEALRPAARRLEFGLRFATAAAALALAIVVVGDFVGLPGGEAGEAPELASHQLAASRQAATPQGTLPAPAGAQPSQVTGEDKAVTEAPTAPPAGAGGVAQGVPSAPAPTPAIAGDVGQGVASPPAPNEGSPETTGTPEAPVPTPSVPPPAATPSEAAPSEAAPPATGPAPETPAPEGTPTPAETPFAAYSAGGTPAAASPSVNSRTTAATATPPPVGAQLSPSEGERQPAADEQAPVGAEPKAQATEEGGPSRETVVRWLEIGLGTGAALLFVSWVLARRRGWA